MQYADKSVLIMAIMLLILGAIAMVLQFIENKKK